MDANDIKIMLDYNVWARERLLTAVEMLSGEQYTRAMGNSFSSVRDTLVHIYGADLIWAERYIDGTSPTTFAAPDTYADVAAIRAAWRLLDARVKRFKAALDDTAINREVAYTSMKSASFSSPLWQVIHHVTNHATYHRGQVTTMIRQLGADPPVSTDLIAYYRQRGG